MSTPPPPAPTRLYATRPLLLVFAVCAGAAMLLRFGVVVVNWRQFGSVDDGRTNLTDLSGAVRTQLILMGIMLVPAFGATATLLTWTWRTRVNAELLSPAAPHRSGRAWATWSWIVPIANLIFPRQVLADVWAASRRPEAPEEKLDQPWWAVSLVGVAVYVVSKVAIPTPRFSYGFGTGGAAQALEGARTAVLLNALSDTLLFALGVLAWLLLWLTMSRITRLQNDRAAQETGPPVSGQETGPPVAGPRTGSPVPFAPALPASDQGPGWPPPAPPSAPAADDRTKAVRTDRTAEVQPDTGIPTGAAASLAWPGTPWLDRCPSAPGATGYLPPAGPPTPNPPPNPPGPTAPWRPAHPGAPVHPGAVRPAGPGYPLPHHPPPRAARSEGLVANLLVWVAVVAGPMSMTLAGLQLSDPSGDNNTALVTLVVALVGVALGPSAAGAAVVFWLWRARANIEVLPAGRPRLGQGWVVGSWVVPVGNLVLPLIVVLDVAVGSGRPHPGRVVAWWGCWIGGWAAVWGAWLCSADSRFGMPGYDGYGPFIVLSVLALLLMAGAAGALNTIITEVNKAQEQRLAPCPRGVPGVSGARW